MPNKNIEQFNPDLNLNGNENLLAMDNGTTVRIPLNIVKTYTNQGLHDYYVTGGTYNNNSIILTRNDGQVITITGITTDNFYTTGVTLNGTVLSFDRNDGMSAYTVDLTSLQFTGNTSANCITDLYVSNIYGCSPITFHGEIMQKNNTVLGTNSVAFGVNNQSGFFQEEISTPIISACTIFTGLSPDYYVTVSGDVTAEWDNYLSSTNPIDIVLSGSGGTTTTLSVSNTYYDLMSYGDFTFLLGSFPVAETHYTAFSTSIITQVGIDNQNTFAGGSNNNAYGDNSFVYSINSAANGARSAVIGGQNITGNNDDTVYVPNLNINTTPLTNNNISNILVRDVDGSIVIRDSSSLGGAISYNRILVVDPVYGNNATATPDRFDKPYTTVFQALSIAGTLTKSSTNRILIYVRAGQYYSDSLYLKDNVDIYCEPGVVFQYAVTVTDVYEPTPVNARLLGHARFDNLTYTGVPLMRIEKASTVVLEFDSVYFNSTLLLCANVSASGTTSDVIVKCNKMESTLTLGAAWAINIRNNTNLRLIVSDYIKANHNVFQIRTSFYGKLIVDCPKIILTATNVYGANYDHCVLIEGTATGSKIIINGDLYSEKSSFGGNASCLLINGGGDCDVELNGNVYGNNSVGVWLNMTTATGKLKVNGDIKSKIRPIILVGTGNVHFKNSNIVLASSTTYDAIIYTNHTGTVFFTNCSFNCEKADTHTFLADGTTGTIMISNSNSYTSGSNGEFFHSNAGAMTLKTHNVRANKPLGVNITDLLSPSGFIYDSNIITPNF